MQSKNLSCFDLILEINKVSRESHDVAAVVLVGGWAVGPPRFIPVQTKGLIGSLFLSLSIIGCRYANNQLQTDVWSPAAFSLHPAFCNSRLAVRVGHHYPPLVLTYLNSGKIDLIGFEKCKFVKQQHEDFLCQKSEKKKDGEVQRFKRRRWCGKNV